MKKILVSLFLVIFIIPIFLPIKSSAYDLDLTKRLYGYILLQVEQHGEAWYVREDENLRYYMKDGPTAYSMMRNFSLGITDNDLATIPEVETTTEMLSAASVCSVNDLGTRLKGRILLQVEQHGEAWYVYPEKCLRIYMKDGEAAYTIMRFLGLGILDDDLELIEPGNLEVETEEPSGSLSVLSWPSDIGTARLGRLTDFDRIDSTIAGGWVRPHPGPFVWGSIEKEPGTYNWDEADEQVIDLQNNRQAILATIWGFADWDQESCHSDEPEAKEPFLEELKHMYAPCDSEAYLDWVKALVERYDGDGVDDMPGLEYPIRYWEVFNEPSMQDVPTFFQDAAEAYADILIDTFTTIKSVDSNAVVLSAGQAGMEDFSISYWEEVIDLAGDYFDVGNIHSIASSEEFNSKEYLDFLDRLGQSNKDFWITEALVGNYDEDLTDEEERELTFIGYVSSFANGAKIIFNVGDHDPSSNLSPEAEEAFELMIEKIGNFETAEWLSDTSVKFTKSDGSVIYALWDSAVLPSSVIGNVTVTTCDSESSLEDASQINSDHPIFVE